MDEIKGLENEASSGSFNSPELMDHNSWTSEVISEDSEATASPNARIEHPVNPFIGHSQPRRDLQLLFSRWEEYPNSGHFISDEDSRESSENPPRKGAQASFSGSGYPENDHYMLGAAGGSIRDERMGERFDQHMAGGSLTGGRGFDQHMAGESLTGGRGFDQHMAGGSLAGGRGFDQHMAGGNLAGGRGFDQHMAGGSLAGGRGFDQHRAGGSLAGGRGFDQHMAGGSLTGGRGFDQYMAGGSLAGGHVQAAHTRGISRNPMTDVNRGPLAEDVRTQRFREPQQTRLPMADMSHSPSTGVQDPQGFLTDQNRNLYAVRHQPRRSYPDQGRASSTDRAFRRHFQLPLQQLQGQTEDFQRERLSMHGQPMRDPRMGYSDGWNRAQGSSHRLLSSQLSNQRLLTQSPQPHQSPQGLQGGARDFATILNHFATAPLPSNNPPEYYLGHDTSLKGSVRRGWNSVKDVIKQEKLTDEERERRKRTKKDDRDERLQLMMEEGQLRMEAAKRKKERKNTI